MSTASTPQERLPLFGEAVRRKVRPAARAVLAVQGAAGALLIATMAVLLIAQVTARNLLPISLFWAEEVARLTLIWATMIGVAYAVGRGIHLTVTAITDYMPTMVSIWFQRAALVLILVVGVLLCYSSWELMGNIGGVAASSSNLPRSVYFLASVVGYGFAALQAALVLVAGPLPDRTEPLDELTITDGGSETSERKTA